MAEDGQAFEAWWDLGYKGLASSAQPVIEVKGLVPPHSVRLDIAWEVEEVGWWIMSRAEPDVAARFARCGVYGVRRARHWVQSLLEAQLAFRTNGLFMMKPIGFLHPDDRGWRLIEALAPLGTDATYLETRFYRSLANLTDGRLEVGISLLAAWMWFVNEVPGIGGRASATLDATHCLMTGLRGGGKRHVRSEDGPGADSGSG
jgi:hypothetical protein